MLYNVSHAVKYATRTKYAWRICFQEGNILYSCLIRIKPPKSGATSMVLHQTAEIHAPFVLKFESQKWLSTYSVCSVRNIWADTAQKIHNIAARTSVKNHEKWRFLTVVRLDEYFRKIITFG